MASIRVLGFLLLPLISGAFVFRDSEPVPEMTLIRGGQFLLGDSLGNADEQPVHRVVIGDFYMGLTEVTVAQFELFVKETAYQTDAERSGGSSVWTPLGWNKKAGVNWQHDEKGVLREITGGNYPVMHVSWNDAVRYCNWLSKKAGLAPVYSFLSDSVHFDPEAGGYRLPAEAEWEYAAAGGLLKKNVRFSGSDNLQEIGWYAGNSGKGAHPVRGKKANAAGLFDCSGNVWEWCADWYSATRYTQTRGIGNSGGPASGMERVIRGGSWSNNPSHCRVANRSSRFPDARDCNLGFRVAR